MAGRSLRSEVGGTLEVTFGLGAGRMEGSQAVLTGSPPPVNDLTVKVTFWGIRGASQRLG